MPESTSERDLTRLRLALEPVVVVPESDDEVRIGNRGTASFVAVPRVGGVVIEGLKDGRSIADVAAEASALAGADVDVEDFLDTLESLDVIDYAAVDVAAYRGVRWIGKLPPWVVAPLFGRVAWCVYGAAFLFAVMVLLLKPELRPTWESYLFLPNPLVALLVLYASSFANGFLHEGYHWLAGIHAGVPARFRISQRGMGLVFETDLTLLLTLPRRRRYGPMLAGLALDSVLLAACLGLRWAYADGLVDLPAWLPRYAGALVLLVAFSMLIQCAVFLRTDLYAVLALALRCDNLYRTSWLTLKDSLRRLDPAESAELDQASPRDRDVARWFYVLYVVGMLAVFWWFVTYAIPSLVSLTFWLVTNLAHYSPATWDFWGSAGLMLLAVGVFFAPLPIWFRERRRRARGLIA